MHAKIAIDLLTYSDENMEFTMSQNEIIFPMSYAQEQLWFESQLKPQSTAYTIANAVQLHGQLDLASLQRSFQEIVKRHETLRTTFDLVDGQLVQIVTEDADLSLDIIPLTHLSQEQQDAEIQRRFVAEEEHIFNLKTGPLIRVNLLQINETNAMLLLTIHHIITDKWSMGILIRELATLYGAFSQGLPSPLPELSIQYGDYAEWQREWLTEERIAPHLSYWKERLAGIPPLLELPTDRPRRTTQTYQGAKERFVLDAELTTGLKALCRKSDATLFMGLLAVYATLLSRYSRQEDIVVGSVIATRKRRELESLIGFFLNNLVLRVTMNNNLSFEELLQQVRQTLLEAYQHQDIPFAHLIQALQPERNTSYSPLFQAVLVLENVPAEPLELPGLTLTPLEIESMTADYDLTLSIMESNQELVGKFIFNADLFDSATIARMCDHFKALLQGILADPKQQLSNVSLLTEAERHQILFEWNNTAHPFPQDKCIHQLVEEQVEHTPDAVAVVFGSQQLTYRELNRRANQVAHYLKKFGVQPEVLIGVCVDRSLEMIIGILGVLKAGGAYVPLDPTYPEERLAFMIQDTEMPVLLTQKKLLTDLPHTTAKIICLDHEWDTIAQQSQEAPARQITPDNLAYVIYTSGSTGTPKGVLLAHRGLCNLAQAQIRKFAVQPGDRVLQFVSFSFDVATSDVFTALCSGATLCLVSKEALLPGPGLLDIFRNLAITHVEIPSPILKLLPSSDLPDLRVIIVGGETCPPELVGKWAPGRRFFNAYGPTETTVCATAAECTDAAQKPPIGRPLDNIQVYLLDAALQPVPIGVPGELYIGGVGVAKGYLHRPDLTMQAFISNPFDQRPESRLYKTGDVARYRSDRNLEFIGRVDYQVKIRGFRIEVEEIEAVLKANSMIDEAAVIVRETKSGDKQLLAYVTAQAEQTMDVDSLRTELKATLPDYMLPSAFIRLEHLPLTPNGKIDRRALPTPDVAQTPVVAHGGTPVTPFEKRVAEIWQATLGLEQIGIQANFFEIGGHSLLAVQIHQTLQAGFGQHVKLTDIFQYPTIQSFAQYLSQPAHDAGAVEPDQAEKRKDRAAAMQKQRQLRNAASE